MNFRVSSGLKDLIGNELITDNNIAVFELVKNSFDAGARKVLIRFENIYEGEARIVIIDDGKGMDLSDLKDKWLFVAYSAKRDGTEEENEDEDYRKKIKLRKFYAGAKGVGRFSCDRLGERLSLITLKNKPNARIENLIVNWRDFEEDQNREFIDINVKHKNPKSIGYDLEHGTILEITGLRNREEWNRESFIRLKEKLSKLIRPQIGNSQQDNLFKITLNVREEKRSDQEYIAKCQQQKKEPEYRQIINGEIKNFIFEHLDLKTTKIVAEIDPEGTVITTSLVDRDTEVYSIQEKNEFGSLKNISTQLYFLNQAAKKTFTTKMGIEPVNYGNVFVYKNGFRIHPYGDPRNDMMGIDTRALQQYSRLLGTRNLIGQIDIVSTDEDNLRETTSRDGGLIRNQAYTELMKFFYEKALKRLEKYVVQVTDWGVDDDDLKELNDKDVRNRLVKHIANITKDDSILDIRYNNAIIKIVEGTEQTSAKTLIRNFKRIAIDSQNDKLSKDAEKLEKKFLAYQALDKENVELHKDKATIQSQLEIEREKNTYLSVRRTLSEDAEKLIHSINFNLTEIDEKVISLINKVKANGLSRGVLLEELSELKFFTEKSRKISEIATRANYKYEAEQQWIDIPTYLREYLSIYNDIKKSEDRSKGVDVIVNDNKAKLKKYISPIEIAILVDNLISNSIKWKDTNKKTIIQVDIRNVNNEKVEILFSDNGRGLSDRFIKNPERIFELGVTETNGSGIGLNSVKRTLEELGGKIEFSGNGVTVQKGACFKIVISK